MSVFDTEVVLTAHWSPEDGVAIARTQLPDEFTSALHRVGHDLHVRQFNGAIGHIALEGHYEPYFGVVWLYSDVTPLGGVPDGPGVSGNGAVLDATEDEIAVSFSALVQDQIARAGIAWPWGRAGGFMTPEVFEGVGTWRGRNAESASIGALRA